MPKRRTGAPNAEESVRRRLRAEETGLSGGLSGYGVPTWLGRALEFDVRSIALFRAILAGTILWGVCFEYIPEADWFLHGTGYKCTSMRVNI